MQQDQSSNKPAFIYIVAKRECKERASIDEWLAGFDHQTLTREDSRSWNTFALRCSSIPNSYGATSQYARGLCVAKLGRNSDYRWRFFANFKTLDKTENKDRPKLQNGSTTIRLIHSWSSEAFHAKSRLSIATSGSVFCETRNNPGLVLP